MAALTHRCHANQRCRDTCIQSLTSRQRLQTNNAQTLGLLTLTAPSLATVFRTTSIAPLYTPFSAVCNLTFTKSNGCPTTTAQIPPAPPATKSRKLEKDFLAAWETSSFSSCAEGIWTLSSSADGICAFISRAEGILSLMSWAEGSLSVIDEVGEEGAILGYASGGLDGIVERGSSLEYWKRRNDCHKQQLNRLQWLDLKVAGYRVPRQRAVIVQAARFNGPPSLNADSM